MGLGFKHHTILEIGSISGQVSNAFPFEADNEHFFARQTEGGTQTQAAPHASELGSISG